MMHKSIKKGFSLIEVLIGTAIFLMVSIAAYGLFTNLFKLASASQANIIAVELASEQFEIIRNMPYTSVALTTGIPQGILPPTQTLVRGNFTYNVGLTIRNNDLTGGGLQASVKLVEVSITCPTCRNFNPVVLTGYVSPANLATASNGGAVTINVFDAKGQPVQGATVILQSVSTSSISNTDITNNSGILNVIGVPQGSNVYRVDVSKSGYSTTRTYITGGAGNPDPVSPHLTVLDGQVSSASFAIDLLSSLEITSVATSCDPIPDFDFDLVGTKQIGDSPVVLKYPKKSLSTGSSGSLNLSNMEWDTYTITPTDATYDAVGVGSTSLITLDPNSNQTVRFVLVPKGDTSTSTASSTWSCMP